MPLARILTRNPERTADLSSQLREQGYKVEVARPDQVNLAPADLEIEFEMCERADVLDRAADLATELEADIAVAPGILQSASEPVLELTPKLTPQAKVQPAPENVVKLAPHKDIQSEAEREFEAAFSSKAEMAEKPAAMQATPEVVEIPVMEQAPLPPVAFMEDPTAAMGPVKIVENLPTLVPEPASSNDSMPYMSQLAPFSAPAARTEAPQTSPAARDSKKALSASESLPASAPLLVSERGKQVLQDGAKIAARTWAGALALTSSTAASVRDHFQEYKKRAQVRSAEARAAHTARLLDLEQRRAEAQQRAAELEAARIAASVRLMELLQQRKPGLHESQSDQSLREQSQPEHGLWQPEQSTYAHSLPQRPRPKESYQREVPPAAASVRPPAPAPRLSRDLIHATPIALWRKVNPPLRAVLTGAAAVSALFVVGIAMGLFHSGAPLASPANHASNNVPVQAANATLPAPTGRTTQAVAKPQPGTGSQPATQVTVKPSPRVQRAQELVAQQSETSIGDDVVIRRFKIPVPTQKPKQSGQEAGLKHFSDLN